MAKDNSLVIASVSPVQTGNAAIISVNGVKYDAAALADVIHVARHTRATGNYNETVPPLDAEPTAAAAATPTAAG